MADENDFRPNSAFSAAPKQYVSVGLVVVGLRIWEAETPKISPDCSSKSTRSPPPPPHPKTQMSPPKLAYRPKAPLRATPLRLGSTVSIFAPVCTSAAFVAISIVSPAPNVLSAGIVTSTLTG